MDLNRPMRYSSQEYNRATGILFAVPFVMCFSIFGAFNLAGGAMLIVKACSSNFTYKARALLQKFMRRSNVKLNSQINPLQVVGNMLLLTGSLLIIIGITLGVVVCRSFNEQQRRRNRRLVESRIPFSVAEKSSRQTSSFSTPFRAPSRSRNEKRSQTGEMIQLPILKVEREEGSYRKYGKLLHPAAISTEDTCSSVSPSIVNISQITNPQIESETAESLSVPQSLETMQSDLHQIKVIVDITPQPSQDSCPINIDNPTDEN